MIILYGFAQNQAIDPKSECNKSDIWVIAANTEV